MQIPTISAHAVKRYMERTGCKKPERARNKIEHCFINGKKLKANAKEDPKVYGHGFVLVIKDNVIVTIYRPTTPSIKKKIYHAHKHERRRLKQSPPRVEAVDDVPPGCPLPKGRPLEEDRRG